MADLKIEISDTFEITSMATYSMSKANCVPIFEDLTYLLKQSRDTEIDQELRNLYARTSIVFMAFYFEALANSIFDKERKDKDIIAELNQYDINTDLSDAIRKMRAAYKKEFSNDIALDIKPIRDLFLIRNQIFAHPKERTTISSNNPALIKNLEYLYFKGFPLFYSDFNNSHADKIYLEVKTFLKNYLELMKDKIPVWLHKQFLID
jgi:hypothetical protein